MLVRRGLPIKNYLKPLPVSGSRRRKRIDMEVGPDSPLWVDPDRPILPEFYLSDFLRRVQDVTGVKPYELMSHQRTFLLVRARRVATYHLKVERGMSFPEIGRKMNRDHTSARECFIAATEQFATDEEFRSMVKRLYA